MITSRTFAVGIVVVLTLYLLLPRLLNRANGNAPELAEQIHIPCSSTILTNPSLTRLMAGWKDAANTDLCVVSDLNELPSAGRDCALTPVALDWLRCSEDGRPTLIKVHSIAHASIPPGIFLDEGPFFDNLRYFSVEAWVVTTTTGQLPDVGSLSRIGFIRLSSRVLDNSLRAQYPRPMRAVSFGNNKWMVAEMASSVLVTLQYDTVVPEMRLLSNEEPSLTAEPDLAALDVDSRILNIFAPSPVTAVIALVLYTVLGFFVALGAITLT